MARKHARLLVTVWKDNDFVSLTVTEQHVFFSLVSSPDLSWCGVCPYLPKRIANTASDLTERKVIAAIKVLRDRKFVVLDEETDEVLVRTFVRHDEVMKVPNVAKGMARSLESVHSQLIRAAVIAELRRELTERPDLNGWKALREVYPQLFDEVSTNPSANPSAIGSGNGWGESS